MGLGAGAGCIAEPGEELVSSSAAPIIGGTNTVLGEYPTLVSIESVGLCTGTLIAPDIVLTAAHCINPQVLGLSNQAAVTSATKVRLDSMRAFSGTGRVIQAKETIPHSGFDINGLGDDDIGIIRLMEPVTDRPPTSINRNFNDAPPGVTVTQVGFGVSQAGNQNSAGTAHTLANKVSISCAGIGLDSALICFNQTDGSGKCEGDSGGPSFATINGTVKVVGVTSFGDQNCTQFGADTRVDGELDFLNQFAPELQCVADGMCTAVCGAGGLPNDPDCATCESSSDCDNNDHVCYEGFCVPGVNLPGGLGAPCADNTQCNSGICGGGPDGMRCTEICEPDSSNCPGGYDCLPAGEQGACWPGADDDGDGGGTCGCRVGGAQGTGAAAGGAFALLLIGALVIARRRRA